MTNVVGSRILFFSLRVKISGVETSVNPTWHCSRLCPQGTCASGSVTRLRIVSAKTIIAILREEEAFWEQYAGDMIFLLSSLFGLFPPKPVSTFVSPLSIMHFLKFTKLQ